MIELVVLGSYEDSGVKKLGKRKEKFLMCHPYLWLILFAKNTIGHLKRIIPQPIRGQETA